MIPTTPLVLIDVPAGRVEHPERVVNMFGGVDVLRDALQTNPNITQETIAFSLSPTAPVIFGDVRSRNDILVRVKRRKSTGEVLSSEPVGIIRHAIEFQGLADFAFVPPPGYVDPSTAVAEHDPTLQQREPLHLAPRIFTRLDRPSSYLYRERVYGRRDPVESAVHVRCQTWKLSAGGPVPTKPVEGTAEALQELMQQKCNQLIAEAFAMRPMWTRGQLNVVIAKGIPSWHIQLVLPLHAYLCETVSGTSCCGWCAFGFDIRENPDIVRKYQRVAFRLDRNSRTAVHRVFPAFLSTRKQQPRRKLRKTTLFADTVDPTLLRWKKADLFEHILSSGSYGVSHSVCDVDDDMFQSIVSFQQAPQLHPANGYMPAMVLSRIRTWFNDEFLRYLSQRFPVPDNVHTLNLVMLQPTQQQQQQQQQPPQKRARDDDDDNEVDDGYNSDDRAMFDDDMNPILVALDGEVDDDEEFLEEDLEDDNMVV